MGSITTRLRIAAWEENPVAEFDDGSKITRASVTLSDGVDGLEAGTIESVMYYRPDGTSHYVNVTRLTAVLDGRSGSVVLAGDGAYDGMTASGSASVVPDSATGSLVGITGTCTSTSTQADYPFMPLALEYDFSG